MCVRRSYDKSNMEKGQALACSSGLDPLGLCTPAICVSDRVCSHWLHGTTLPQGSFIIGTRIFSEPEVGDIIVFEKDGMLLVKRVAAGPGDTVDLSQLTYMNSVPLPVREETIIIVPEDCYFVLGDNSQNSWDSRYWDTPYVSSVEVVAIISSHFSS